jgi:NTP pyrophosphatase (non-canonical NTP hydrolase)
MTFDDYQAAAFRTQDKKLHRDEILVQGALGLTGESGEVADIIKKVMFHGHEYNEDKLVLELGDVLWYVANTARAIGVSLEHVAKRNIQKLEKRFPDGFSFAASINRSDD